MTEVSVACYRLKGTVQGVGMRPTLWRLATELNLSGYIWNDTQGVVIQVWGDGSTVTHFVKSIPVSLPPLAQLESVQEEPIDQQLLPPDTMRIMASKEAANSATIAPDAATCPQCISEIFDPENRRFHYPFTCCTHCGPRFSLVDRVPYDRVNTQMVAFDQCAECLREYNDPADRRYHAQTNACPHCGPKIWLEQNGDQTEPSTNTDVIMIAVELLKGGAILAVKGLTGFHLVCDATNKSAIQRLRTRKQRPAKPLALMAKDVVTITRYAQLSELEERHLESTAAPIVLLTAKGQSLPGNIAPDQRSLGFMLPNNPLQHLLLREVDRPLIVTSGNLAGEPHYYTNELARQHLGEIADALLMHDRDIVSRQDDSVVEIVNHTAICLRRGRGFAPAPISASRSICANKSVLALGAELKGAFCFLREGQFFLSQYMGDLKKRACYDDFCHQLDLQQKIYNFTPELIAVDGHPNYLSTQLGQQLAMQLGVPLRKVQHHHAHVAAVLAEHGYDSHKPVLGIVLDGLGYGENSALWGGEILIAHYACCERVGGLQPVPLIGAAQAMQEPWRNLLAHLLELEPWSYWQKGYPNLETIKRLQAKPLDNLIQMHHKRLNSPLASSAGRLFDAVAAALVVAPDRQSYEGQAALVLESLAAPYFDAQYSQPYPIESANNQLQWRQFWDCLLKDVSQNVKKEIIAARFHQGLVSALTAAALSHCQQRSIDTVVLSGGVMQNRLLLRGLYKRLTAAGLNILWGQQAPMNDGGIAIGQAAVAAVL